MNNPFVVDPKQLTEARMLCHLACQWPSKAARANLNAADDDSHSNLGWQDKYDALVSHPLDERQRIQLGLSFSSRALIWLVDGAVDDQLDLHDQTEASVGVWVESHLTNASLASTQGVVMPYELEGDAQFSMFTQLGDAVSALGAWFDFGQQGLAYLVKEFGGRCIDSTTVRCWPHHFDLGALFVLEAGDPETARSIGVGLAPGDGSFDEPYFYCSPYPAPRFKPTVQLPGPLFWNTEGFVSVILRSSEMDERTDLNDLLYKAFSVAHDMT